MSDKRGILQNKPDFPAIEKKWQEFWFTNRIFQPDINGAQKPYYCLMMFPYPSAEGLHVGNMYAFTGADIYARFKRMQGHDVFEPIGLDGFGIHSENYAIKVGKHPKEQAKISEENFYRQLKATGNSYAWENKVETYKDDYYNWTQWLFTEMFKNGLAYRKKSPVNFCPSCKTVLSDEQVIDGQCERCKSQVEKKDMEQWFFRISHYSKRLLENTYREDFVWSEKVKTGQRSWIGRKEGIIIEYNLLDKGGISVTNSRGEKEILACFTTRPDTNWGATFVVVSPEHPLVKDIILGKIEGVDGETRRKIEKYVQEAVKVNSSQRIAQGGNKTGVDTGLFCINGLNNYKMPLFVSDFVLMDFGTGAVVGVPGHDKRDFEFAQKFQLPVVRVVVGKDNDSGPITSIDQVQEEEGLMINSGFLNGLEINKAIFEMMNYLEVNKMGFRQTIYRLRDWCISRQRYWGAPIPMIFCAFCKENGQSYFKDPNNPKPLYKDFEEMNGWYPVPEENLPVTLPDLDDWKPEGSGKGPLAKADTFVRVKCPACKADAQRESDVCDTFLDSSWYFLRYPSVGSENRGERAFNGEITKKWLPVDMYIGGAEHTVLHLLYARFITMALSDMGYLSFEEPFKRFFAHGLIIAQGAKMSKSRGNVVNPDEYIAKYGADSLRMYLMFLGPFADGGDFRDSGMWGMYRFLAKVYKLINTFISEYSGKGKVVDDKENEELVREMHRKIRDIGKAMENLQYNRAIAFIMELVNAITDSKKEVPSSAFKNLIMLLAPFAPHISEELYQKGRAAEGRVDFSSVHFAQWPGYDESLAKEDETVIAVQVNGKVRDTVSVPTDKSGDEEYVYLRALSSEKVKKHIKEAKVVRKIFVKGRVMNIIVE